MKLSEFLDWRPLVENYWNCKIDEAVAGCTITYDSGQEIYVCPITDPTIESNTIETRNSLKNSLLSYMDSLEAKYLEFFENPKVKKLFMSLLLSVGSYIVSKEIAVAEGIIIPNLETLQDNDTGSVFGNSDSNLPSYNDPQLFVIEEITEDDGQGGSTTTYNLLTGVQYDTLLSIFSNLFGNYEDNVNAAIEEIGDAQLERGIYMLTAGKDAEVVYDMEVDIKSLLLFNYGVQDVLDQFQWDIRGLNL